MLAAKIQAARKDTRPDEIFTPQIALAAGRSAVLGPRQQPGLTIKGFDRGYAFMLVEIAGDELYFQTISEKGQTVDYGVITKGENNRVIGTTGPVARLRNDLRQRLQRRNDNDTGTMRTLRTG